MLERLNRKKVTEWSSLPGNAGAPPARFCDDHRRPGPCITALALAAMLLMLAAPGCENEAGRAPEAAAPETAPAPADAAPPQTGAADEAPPPGDPPVRFDPPGQIDFGLVAPGETVRGTATIHNTGETPLRIMGARPSCGCTKIDPLDGKVIEPGGALPFEISMEVKPGLGEDREGVQIAFYGYRNAVQYFFVAEVALPVRVVPPYLAASAPSPGQSPPLSGVVTVESVDGEPFTILAAGGEAPRFVKHDPASDPPAAHYELRWDITREHRTGTVPWFWVIETDRDCCPVIDVRVRHDSTRPERPRGRPWVAKQQRLLLGTVQPGETIEAEARIEYALGVEPDPVTAAVTGAEGVDVELFVAERDGQFINYRLRITPRESLPPGLLYAEAALHASGFQTPLYLIGRVP